MRRAMATAGTAPEVKYSATEATRMNGTDREKMRAEVPEG